MPVAPQPPERPNFLGWVRRDLSYGIGHDSDTVEVEDGALDLLVDLVIVVLTQTMEIQRLESMQGHHSSLK